MNANMNCVLYKLWLHNVLSPFLYLLHPKAESCLVADWCMSCVDSKVAVPCHSMIDQYSDSIVSIGSRMPTCCTDIRVCLSAFD